MKLRSLLGAFAFGALLVSTTNVLAADCQMLLTFGPRDGWYDRSAHTRMKQWLKSQPDRVKFVETFRAVDGSGSLCIVVRGPDDIQPLFDGMKQQLEQNPPKKGSVELFSKVGVWYRPDPDPASSRVRGSGYVGERGPPRDNPGRPPPAGSRF